MSDLNIPEVSLVVLIGASSSGKSTFARTHFLPTEIVSSDVCRALVSDVETNQDATADAFEVLHLIVAKRLARGRLTVIDATNVQPAWRKPLISLAREHHVLPVAIVFDLPERDIQARNRSRSDRQTPSHAIHRHVTELRQGIRGRQGLEREGFRHVWFFRSEEEVNEAQVVRQRLWTDRRDDHGPFDIVGDIHGCFDELLTVLNRLGYELAVTPGPDGDAYAVGHPEGRRLIFLGDLVDRGPRIPDTLRLVMDTVRDGVALCVPGNHDAKLVRALRGRKVQVRHGLEESLRQVEAEPAEFRDRAATFLDRLVSHYVLDGGDLVVAHAGMRQELQGRSSSVVRDFALFGETTGEMDDAGLPVRVEWARAYRGPAAVVYGHTPVARPEWLNNTINIDTGCVFGGSLTALRWPEREIVSVVASRVYSQPARPFPLESVQPASDNTDPVETTTFTAQQRSDELLEITDILGHRVIETRLMGKATIRAEQAAAAMETIARFSVDPRWLIHLPPTMSPPETSSRPDMLEHPDETFAYFRQSGVQHVVCEAKHMGSRAIVIICRDESVARARFGVHDGSSGSCYTRTGRPFFTDAGMLDAVLDRIRAAMASSGLWSDLGTGWVCLDAEVLPWSLKAQDLLRQQYAPAGRSGVESLRQSLLSLDEAIGHGTEAEVLHTTLADRLAQVERYVAVYGGYVWPVSGIADVRLAPFHLLASEGAVHVDKPHRWHLETLSRLAAGNDADPPFLITTANLDVDLNDEQSVRAGISWWEDLTASGGEGMVVKPADFVTRRGARDRLVQPAIKCRGREYMRLTYGAEYALPQNLERLRARAVAGKRSLALREFALGIEGLERFVRREPLHRIHECALGVLALESEPIDPRL